MKRKRTFNWGQQTGSKSARQAKCEQEKLHNGQNVIKRRRKKRKQRKNVEDEEESGTMMYLWFPPQPVYHRSVSRR